MSSFVDERHNLFVGWVFGIAMKQGVPIEPVYDDEGIVTDRMVLHLSEGIDLIIVVPPPPDDWTLMKEER